MLRTILLLMASAMFVLAEENLFKPLPTIIKSDTEKVALGRLLFHDPILSKDSSISCATCHPLINYGVDGLEKSFGVNGAIGKRNTPTVWNARYNFSQFWDGRAKDLKEQALVPITTSFEMNETLDGVVKKLSNDKNYTKYFQRVYDDGVTAANIADAIAAFEMTLVTPDSKFDLFLKGDKSALTPQEQEGLSLFKSKGCVACHNGINIGGTLYQKIGVFGDIPSGSDDLGRYHITKKAFDKQYFKVPSLRNVEKTAPYFHDGSAATLREAVETMVDVQLGRMLEEKEIEKIVLFLKTLTGKVHE